MFAENWFPIQVKQVDKVGRPDIDQFEAVMERENRERGFFVKPVRPAHKTEGVNCRDAFCKQCLAETAERAGLIPPEHLAPGEHTGGRLCAGCEHIGGALRCAANQKGSWNERRELKRQGE